MRVRDFHSTESPTCGVALFSRSEAAPTVSGPAQPSPATGGQTPASDDAVLVARRMSRSTPVPPSGSSDAHTTTQWPALSLATCGWALSPIGLLIATAG